MNQLLVIVCLVFSYSSLVGCGKSLANPIRTVEYTKFPTKVAGMRVESYPGTESDTKEIFYDFRDDPQGIIIHFEDARSYPTFDKRPVYGIKAYNVLRVLSLEQIDKHYTLAGDLEHLQRLLKERPATSSPNPNDSKHILFDLPDFPYRHAGHIVQTKISYHDFEWGSGISYVVGLSNGLGYYPTNEDVSYFFQGVSNDNKYYVSADFRITHPYLSDSIDKQPDSAYENDRDCEKISHRLNNSKNSSFSPSLSSIHKWLAEIKVEVGTPDEKGQ